MPAATTAPAVVKATKEGLAPGMIGGPTGFPGCEHYQYPADSPAGRAMLALQALPKDKKPEKLVMMLPTGATGHWTVPFPTDAAPTTQQVFEEESGIKLEVVGVDAEQPDDQDRSGRHDQSRRLRPLLDVAARQGHPVRGRRTPRFG